MTPPVEMKNPGLAGSGIAAAQKASEPVHIEVGGGAQGAHDIFARKPLLLVVLPFGAVNTKVKQPPTEFVELEIGGGTLLPENIPNTPDEVFGPSYIMSLSKLASVSKLVKDKLTQLPRLSEHIV